MKIPKIYAIFIYTFLVQCVQGMYPYDGTVWKTDGTVSLTSLLNSNLCVRTESYAYETSVLKLIDCSLEYSRESFLGQKQFQLHNVADDAYQIKTYLYRPSIAHYDEACFYTESEGNLEIITKNCNHTDTSQFWEFPKTVGNQVQFKHRDTGKCATVSSLTNGTTLVLSDCNTTDSKQLWAGEFLEVTWKWEDAGIVTLKSLSNPALCIRTNQLNYESSVLALVSCSKDYNGPYKGDKEYNLGKVSGGYYQIRTLHLPSNSDYGVYACLYTGSPFDGLEKSEIHTNHCDYNNSELHWKFLELPANNTVQVVHRNTGKCIQGVGENNSLTTANCDENNVNQIWIREFQ